MQTPLLQSPVQLLERRAQLHSGMTVCTDVGKRLHMLPSHPIVSDCQEKQQIFTFQPNKTVNKCTKLCVQKYLKKSPQSAKKKYKAKIQYDR